MSSAIGTRTAGARSGATGVGGTLQPVLFPCLTPIGSGIAGIVCTGGRSVLNHPSPRSDPPAAPRLEIGRGADIGCEP